MKLLLFEYDESITKGLQNYLSKREDDRFASKPITDTLCFDLTDITPNEHCTGLTGVVIVCEDLQNSRFSGSDLYAAVFSGSNLDYSDFSHCDLRGAIFDGCSLKNANFDYALLNNGTIGSGADFSGANLLGATFNYANLHGAIYDKETVLPKDRDITENMTFIELSQVQR